MSRKPTSVRNVLPASSRQHSRNRNKQQAQESALDYFKDCWAKNEKPTPTVSTEEYWNSRSIKNKMYGIPSTTTYRNAVNDFTKLVTSDSVKDIRLVNPNNKKDSNRSKWIKLIFLGILMLLLIIVMCVGHTLIGKQEFLMNVNQNSIQIVEFVKDDLV